MILLEEPKSVVVSGNFQTKAFSILASSKAFDILSSRIYTHKARAIIREISCNAFDSHVEAKNPNPFYVHLPTYLEPWFAVRDYGTGISPENMMSLYSEFFRSTRNKSNDFVGSLGIGRVSPFCLVDSFTVKSWFNGTCNTYSCYKDEKGEPQIALLTSSDSDEANGVEVLLSIDNRNEEFRREATFVYSYFDSLPEINDKTVLEEIKKAREYPIKTDKFAFRNRYGELKAVMGNVAYDIPHALRHEISAEGYLKFNIGELSFDAGRESLSLDDKTRDLVKERVRQARQEVEPLITAEIEAEPTPYRKFLKAKTLGVANFFSINLSKYDLPDSKEYMTYYYPSRGKCRKGLTKDIESGMEIFKYEKGYTGRIQEYVRTNNKRVLIVNDENITEIGIDLDVIKDAKTLPKTAKSSGGSSLKKLSGLFEYSGKYNSRTGRWAEAEIDLTDKSERVYVKLYRHEPDGGFDSLKTFLMSIGDTVKIYGVNNQFMETSPFKKLTWISLEDYAKRVISEKKLSTNSPHEYHDEIIYLSGYVKSEELDEYSTLTKNRLNIPGFLNPPDAGTMKVLGDDILKKWPLIRVFNTYEIRDNKNEIASYLGGTAK